MKNLMPVVLMIAELGNVADSMGRTTGSARYMAAMQLMDEAAALGGVDFSKVDDEFKEALKDPAKMTEIQTAFANKLDIEDDKLEAFIEEGILLIRENYELIQKDIAFIKKIKSA